MSAQQCAAVQEQDASWGHPLPSRHERADDDGWGHPLVPSHEETPPLASRDEPQHRGWSAYPDASNGDASSSWRPHTTTTTAGALWDYGAASGLSSWGADAGDAWLSDPAPAQFSNAWSSDFHTSAGGWSDVLNTQGEGIFSAEGVEGESDGRQLQMEDGMERTPGSSRIGAGLANMGNTCFLNSVLQCLTYTTPLLNYLLESGDHKTSCQLEGFCAMCALGDHVKAALSSPGRVISPSNLVKNLSCISDSFRLWQQEDAHEYMLYLIEALHKCCVQHNSAGNSGNSHDTSFVSKVFGGRLRSQVKCAVCSYCSDTFDPFLDLSLGIEKSDTLLDALTCFTALEAVEGETKYQCTECKQEVSASKQFTIDKPPEVLIIQLKRFSSSGFFGTKIDKSVEFGLFLDLKPFISNVQTIQEGDLKYTLYAVLVHSGWSTCSGHYYSFVRTSTGIWHVLNDSLVDQVSEKTVLEQNAYILFYIRGGLEGCYRLEASASKASPRSTPVTSVVDDSMKLFSSESKAKEICVTNCSDNIDNIATTCSTPVRSNSPIKMDVQMKATLNDMTVSACKPKSISNTIGVDLGGLSETSVEKCVPTPILKCQPTLIRAGFSSLDTPSEADERHGSGGPQKLGSKPGNLRQPSNAFPTGPECQSFKSPSPADSFHEKSKADSDACNKFQNGTQHSYVRLLNAMPAHRRALLASALPTQNIDSSAEIASDMPAKSRGGNKKRSLVQESTPKIKKHQRVDDSETSKHLENEHGFNKQDGQLHSDRSLPRKQTVRVGKTDSRQSGALEADDAIQHLNDLAQFRDEGHDTASRREIRSKRMSDPLTRATADTAFSSHVKKPDPQAPSDCSPNENSSRGTSVARDCKDVSGSEQFRFSTAKPHQHEESLWSLEGDEVHDRVGSQKLQRGVGGKRILASLIDSQGSSLCSQENVSKINGSSKLGHYFPRVDSSSRTANVASLR